MQLHDPDSFEMEQALHAFESGEVALSKICNDLGIRPGPVYDEYVRRLREGRQTPPDHSFRTDVEQHSGFDRVYNDLPIVIKTISQLYNEWYLYELADYEPLPDTEWVIFFLPRLGFVKLYTSLFYDLGCYVEILFPDAAQKESARNLAESIAAALNAFYRKNAQKEKSLSHG